MMESQQLLANVGAAFRTKCVDGITVNEKVLQRLHGDARSAS